jgi:hypothetical protein
MVHVRVSQIYLQAPAFTPGAVSLAGSGGIAFAGTADLTVTTSAVDLAGSGGIVFAGTADLSIAGTVDLAGSGGIVFAGSASLSVVSEAAAGFRSWVQLLGDSSSRVGLHRVKAVRQPWSVDGESIWPALASSPSDARGEYVTSEWTLELVWDAGETGDAHALFDLLREAAVSADARVEVHLGAPHGGAEIEFVGETHQVPQTVGVAKTEATLTFRQVDS